jgi:autotransporter translocation and assembly factor TamB
VESRLSTLVPVDRIEIEPSFSRTTGTTEPRLSIGKDLTEKLTALLGTGLGTERRQDVALEYQLGPRVSLQAAWESQTQSSAGAFGGTIKFRHSFWKFSLLPGSLLSESSR